MTDIFQQPYYRVNKFFLCCAGLWPYQSRTRRLLLLALILSTATVQMISHIRVIVRVWDFEVITETTPALIIFLCCAISLILMTVNSGKLLKMFQQIEIDWIFVAEQPEMHILRGYVKKGKQITIVLTVGAYFLTILYMSQPYLPGFEGDMEIGNETASKRLPIPADYFGLDIDVYYYYMLTYMCSFYVYGILIAVTIDATFVVLVQHACGMFSVVGFCGILESTYTWAFLPLLGISVVIIGASGYQAIFMIEKNPNRALRCLAFPMDMITHQFILSLFSQKLIDHSQRISEYLYQAEWYRTSLATQKLLNLVTMRAHVPCQMTAGKIITMSLANFVVALKTSLTYFAVTRSMQEMQEM